MRHRIVIAVALATSAVALGGSVAGAAAASGGPVLRIADSTPLTIAGLRFRPHERVSIRLTVNGRAITRIMRASAGGRFRVIVGNEPSGHPCDGGLLSAIASGARGSRAFLKIAQPLCPPPLALERQP
jgi:hypothetical protein